MPHSVNASAIAIPSMLKVREMACVSQIRFYRSLALSDANSTMYDNTKCQILIIMVNKLLRFIVANADNDELMV